MTDPANTELVDLLEHVWDSMAELGRSLDENEWKAPPDTTRSMTRSVPASRSAVTCAWRRPMSDSRS